MRGVDADHYEPGSTLPAQVRSVRLADLLDDTDLKHTRKRQPTNHSMYRCHIRVSNRLEGGELVPRTERMGLVGAGGFD